jgi:hypothetical protein
VIQVAAKEFEKEAANDQYEDVAAGNEYVGKSIYTGKRGFTDLPRG